MHQGQVPKKKKHIDFVGIHIINDYFFLVQCGRYWIGQLIPGIGHLSIIFSVALGPETDTTVLKSIRRKNYNWVIKYSISRPRAYTSLCSQTWRQVNRKLFSVWLAWSICVELYTQRYLHKITNKPNTDFCHCSTCTYLYFGARQSPISRTVSI